MSSREDVGMTGQELELRIRFHTEEANRLLATEPLVREFARHSQQAHAFHTRLVDCSASVDSGTQGRRLLSAETVSLPADSA